VGNEAGRHAVAFRVEKTNGHLLRLTVPVLR